MWGCSTVDLEVLELVEQNTRPLLFIGKMERGLLPSPALTFERLTHLETYASCTHAAAVGSTPLSYTLQVCSRLTVTLAYPLPYTLR